MRNCLLIFIFLLPVYSGAQVLLYTDSTGNLPTAGASGQSMDVVAVDVNGDGDLDIVLANEFQRNRLLFNDGSGHFAAAGILRTQRPAVLQMFRTTARISVLRILITTVIPT
jgi:hypothetical protein